MIEENGSVSNLPKGWVLTDLGEICNSRKGKKPKNYLTEFIDGYYPYILVEQLEGGEPKIYTNDTDCMTCAKDDVLIVWDGSIGKCAIGFEGAIGSTIVALRAIEFHPKYLKYFIEYNKPLIQSTSRGTGLQHVNPQVFRYLSFPLSPLPEQHRIVAKIEELFTRLDAGVEALQKIKTQVKQYRQAVLKYAFEGKLTEEWRESHRHELEPASVLLERIKEERKSKANGKIKELPMPDTSDLPELPVGWSWTRIGEVFDVYVGATPSRARPDYWGGEIPWVSSGEVAFCRIHDTKEYITELGLSKTSTNMHQPGTVLLGMIGEGKTRGQAAILDIAACNNQNSAAIRVSERGMPPEYIYYFLEYYYEITRTLGSGNNQPALNKSRVQFMTFPLTVVAEQEMIIQEIERHLSIADEIEKTINQSLKQAEKLRQSILKRAFEGKLVPQDPNDEPADKLLERIKAEKATKEAERKTQKRSRIKAGKIQGRMI